MFQAQQIKRKHAANKNKLLPRLEFHCQFSNSVHERQQLPLKLAWALTIHKSHGLTLPQAWVDIGKSEQTLGITYVALSRVKQLSSLIVEPMTFDRLKSINKSANLKYRQEEEHRLKQKSETTKCFFQQ